MSLLVVSLVFLYFSAKPCTTNTSKKVKERSKEQFKKRNLKIKNMEVCKVMARSLRRKNMMEKYNSLSHRDKITQTAIV